MAFRNKYLIITRVSYWSHRPVVLSQVFISSVDEAAPNQVIACTVVQGKVTVLVKDEPQTALKVMSSLLISMTNTSSCSILHYEKVVSNLDKNTFFHNLFLPSYKFIVLHTKYLHFIPKWDNKPPIQHIITHEVHRLILIPTWVQVVDFLDLDISELT